MEKLPIQKSIASSAARYWVNQMTKPVPMSVMNPISVTEPRRSRSSPSSIKAMAGWSMERELVSAAMKRRKNQRKPKSWPAGMWAKTRGRVWKPRPKVPPVVPATPRKIKAAGMVIRPPSETSQNSFPAAAVVELRAISSLFLR